MLTSSSGTLADFFNGPVSYAVIRKAHKSTKSTDDGGQASTNKRNDSLPSFMFSSDGDLNINEHFKKKIAGTAVVDGATANDNKEKTLTVGLPLTHRERCQRIIDQAFGKSDNMQPDPGLSPQYFSHTNLEDTRREIHESEKEKIKLQEQKIHTDSTNRLLPDDRCGVFKMSREMNLINDNEMIITNSSSAKELDLTKNLENVMGNAKKTPPVEKPTLFQAKEDFDKCFNNPESIEKKTLCVEDAETFEVCKDERNPVLYKKAIETNQPQVPWFLNACNARETNLTYAKEDVDMSVNNPKSIEKKPLCDDGAETIKVVKDERKPDLYQEATPNDQPHTPQVLNATTAKHEEELLTQKLETIEETPIVEAHNSKLEGNVTPRVLGNESTLNCGVIKNTQATSNDQPHTPQVLNATTAKHEEELLTQKLETIEETPIVEAHNPKLEGNVTPRVLGNESTLNCGVIKNTQATSNDQPHTPQVLNATTAKHEEELLTQKLETIEETPIVEAHNPKLEGNVTPRVLGNEPTLNFEVIKNTQATSNDQPHTPQVLNATTANQEEELLTQKLETIEETPIVEAHNPKLEGNVTPRVLGNESTLNFGVIKNTQATLNDPPHTPQVLNATTANQEEELLTQKLETIEETPIVEAHNSKLEGNVTPRVLGNESTLNCGVIKNTQATSNDQPHTPQVLNATTAKQEEELLTQKLETIEETPIVEAHNPKLEGNVTPRVLGNEPTLNFKVIKNTQATSNDQPHTPQVLNATTANQEEEILTKKLETIEETPIVEAHNPKLEGNVTPRVLGNEPRLNCKVIKNTQDNFPKLNLPGALDEVSKRCLNCPLGQVDEMLINEMEKLGMTYRTAQEAPSTPMEDDLVQMDEQEILYESTKLKKKGNHRATDTREPAVNVKAEALRKSEEIIKPAIDLQSAPYEGEEYDPAEVDNCTKLSCNYLPPTHRTAKLDMDSEKASLPEKLLKERTLNPCYVLTCNETCAISPGCTMCACQNSDFVDTTETIYMKKNICESVRPTPQPIVKCEKMSQVHPNEVELESEATPEMHATGVSEIKRKRVSDSIGMPNLDEHLSLTELLKRVRERSRLAYSQTKVGKCGSKAAPQCNPVGPRSPPNNPVPPPTFGLPMLKRRPPVCPRKNKPCIKCTRATNYPEIPYELNEAEVCTVRSNVNLTDEVVDHLQNVGKILVGVSRQAKSNVETLAVRDYEPWAPIPSWNIAQKSEKKEWLPGMTGVPPCVKGCPNFPKARASMNPEPPCKVKPCEGFPKRRSFYKLDYFPVSLGENIVYDLGDF